MTRERGPAMPHGFIAANLEAALRFVLTRETFTGAELAEYLPGYVASDWANRLLRRTSRRLQVDRGVEIHWEHPRPPGMKRRPPGSRMKIDGAGEPIASLVDGDHHRRAEE